MAEIVSLQQHRIDVQAKEGTQDRAVDQRDLDMIAEVERRFAEAMFDVAQLGGVSVTYLDALMRETWSIPAGGGVAMTDPIPKRAGTLPTDTRLCARGRLSSLPSARSRPHLFPTVNLKGPGR